MGTAEIKPTVFLRGVKLETTIQKLKCGYDNPIFRDKFTSLSKPTKLFDDQTLFFLDKNGNKIYIKEEKIENSDVCGKCGKNIETTYRIPVKHERHMISSEGKCFSVDIFHVGGKPYCTKEHLMEDLKILLIKDIYGIYTDSLRLFKMLCEMMDEELKSCKTSFPRYKTLPFTIEHLEM